MQQWVWHEGSRSRLAEIAVCLSYDTKSAGDGLNKVQHIELISYSLLFMVQTSVPVRTLLSFFFFFIPSVTWKDLTSINPYGNGGSTLDPVPSRPKGPPYAVVRHWGLPQTKQSTKEQSDHHSADVLFHWTVIILISSDQWTNGPFSISAPLKLANGLVNWWVIKCKLRTVEAYRSQRGSYVIQNIYQRGTIHSVYMWRSNSD